MKKNHFTRILAMVLTICMVAGMFVGAVGAAEPETGSVTATVTSFVNAKENGHYPVEFVLTNTTNTAHTVKLVKTAGEAEFTYRGTSANNGTIQLDAMSQQKISGYLSFTDAANQRTNVTVEVREGSTVLDTVTIKLTAEAGDFVAKTAMFDFNSGTKGWTGASYDSDEGALVVPQSGLASYNNLKLVPGHVYKLTFKAKNKSDGASAVYARVRDFDKDGKELAVPNSLYNFSLATKGEYREYEYRFVANTSGDANYAYSALCFDADVCDLAYVDYRNGVVLVDDVVLVDCGEAGDNMITNGDFEEMDPSGFGTEGNGFPNWVTANTEGQGTTTGCWYNQLYSPYVGEEMMHITRDPAIWKYTEEVYTTSEEVTISAWGFHHPARNFTTQDDKYGLKIAVLEYLTEDSEPIEHVVKGTFANRNWNRVEITYKKPDNVAFFRVGLDFHLTEIKGTYVDHVTMHVTEKASEITDDVIANGEKIDGFDGDLPTACVPTMPEIAAPDAARVANSMESLVAAVADGDTVSLVSNITVDGAVDVSNVNFNGYKLVLVYGAEVSGAKEENVMAAQDHYLINTDGVFSVRTTPCGTINDVGRSLSLDGIVYINQYVTTEGFEGTDVTKDGGLLVFKNPVTEVKASYENADVIKAGLTKDVRNYVQQTHGIAAKEYADDLYMRAYVKTTKGGYDYGPLVKYGVQDYCEGRLEKSTDGKLKRLAAAMLHYGTAAQNYFDYNTENPANANILETWPAVEWDPILLTPLKDFTTNVAATGDVKAIGKTLSLEGAIKINYYFAPADNADWTVDKAELLVWDGVSEELTLDNVSYTKAMTQESDRWLGRSNDFVAKEMGKTIFACARFTDTDGKVHYSDVTAYSPEAYAASRIEKSTNPEMVELAKRMVIYGEYAAIYFGVSDTPVKPPVQEEEEDKPVVDHPTIATPDDVPYGDYLVYENEPQAHIMLSENATELEHYAAKELQDHVEMVTGAKLPLSIVDIESREFSSAVEPTEVYAGENGYYSVKVSLKNPTDKTMALTLRQKADEAEEEPVLTMRGDNGNDGVVTMAAYNELVVNGYLAVSETIDPVSTVEIEVVENGTVIATLPISFTSRATVVSNGDFEAAELLWDDAALDSGKTYQGASALKVVENSNAVYNADMSMTTGHLYYLAFYATSDADNTVIRAKVSDFDASGAALKTPMSLNARSNVMNGKWSYHEFRFYANTTEDAAYAASQLSLEAIGGNVWIDDVVLIDYGPFEEEAIKNSDFETYNPDASPCRFTDWWINQTGFEDVTTPYTGERAAYMVPSSAVQGYGGFNAMKTGTTYSVTFWAKAANDNTTLTWSVNPWVGNASYSVINHEFKLSTEWELYEVVFTTPEVPTGVQYHGTYMNFFCTGEYWLDHYRIHDISGATFGGVIAKYSFDSDLENWNAGAHVRWFGETMYLELNFGSDDQTAKAYSPALTLEAGHKYGLKLNARAWSLGISPMAMKVMVEDYAADGTVTAALLDETTVMDETYTDYEYTFVATGSDHSKISLNAFTTLNGDSRAQFTIDSVELVDLGAVEAAEPEAPALAAPVYNSLTVFIVTPESYPALEKLFPEDLEWLEGSDGFAIRQLGGTIYIFGEDAQATQNGVYDFIEENLGVIWFRADDIAYTEMDTVKPEAVNYREKSPFAIRGWHLGGNGDDGVYWSDLDTILMMRRNKMNSKQASIPQNVAHWDFMDSIGLNKFFHSHNIYQMLLENPLYPDDDPDLWCTDEYGNTPENAWHPHNYQFNMWSEKTVDAVVATAFKYMQDHPDLKYMSVGMSDVWYTTCLPYSELPFEWAPGKFVYPDDYNYESTVFFTWLNKVAERFGEVYPDVKITTLAYMFAERVPECEINDNIILIFAPLQENLKEPYYTTKEDPNNEIYQNMLDWKEKTTNVVFYNYYSCYIASANYERPIGERIQQDMQYYAEMGFLGTFPEGVTDSNTSAACWAMNQLTWWLYQKFTWNPYEDLEALTEHFCNTVYGPEAGPYMKEYYDLAKACWDENEGRVYVTTSTVEYLEWFVLESPYLLDMQEALNKAWKAAEGVYKERMRYIKNNFDTTVLSASNQKIEEASALYTTAGKDAVLAATDYSDPIWEGTQVMTNCYNNATLQTVVDAITNVRLLWDEDYLYVAYEMFDTTIGNIKTSNGYSDSSNSWWNAKSDDVETYLTLDPNCQDYYAYFTNPDGLNFRYIFQNGFRRHDPTPCDWDFSTTIIDVEGEENDKWVLIQAVSWDSLGLKGEATKDTEIFGYFYRMYNDEQGAEIQIGWNGATVWTPRYLRQIELRTEPYVDNTPDGPIIPDDDTNTRA